MPYSCDGDSVTLTMTRDQFNELMFALGLEAGRADKRGDPEFPGLHLRVANALNDGNPNWTHYTT